MWAGFVAHHMLCSLFVLCRLCDQCLFKVLEVIRAECIEALCYLCDELLQDLNRDFPLLSLLFLINHLHIVLLLAMKLLTTFVQKGKVSLFFKALN